MFVFVCIWVHVVQFEVLGSDFSFAKKCFGCDMDWSEMYERVPKEEAT
jgi:hypothetical protein